MFSSDIKESLIAITQAARDLAKHKDEKSHKEAIKLLKRALELQELLELLEV